MTGIEWSNKLFFVTMPACSYASFNSLQCAVSFEKMKDEPEVAGRLFGFIGNFDGNYVDFINKVCLYAVTWKL